jgi:hypothetical protein
LAYRCSRDTCGGPSTSACDIVGVVNTAFVKREEVATDWVVAECGVTQSGRVRTVFKTELSFNQLFQRYQDSVGKGDQVSVNIFAR